jgi:hypothetical protein
MCSLNSRAFRISAWASSNRPAPEYSPAGGHGHLGGDGLVVPEPAPVEIRGQRPPELPRPDIRAGGGGVVDRGEQHRALRREPGESLGPVGEELRTHPRQGRPKGDRITRRVQQPVRRVRRVQVMVQQTVARFAALLVGVGGVAEFGRVRAEQVVE